MRNGSFTVTDFRLYDETSSSKGRSPAAHIAQNVACVAALFKLPKQNEWYHAGYSWRQMSEKCLLDPLGVAHEVVEEVCLITTQTIQWQT